MYMWNKETTTAVSGTWTCSGYEFSGTTPYLYYEFSGTDAVPSDAEGYLVFRAKITDSAGRVSMGTKGSIRVLRDELT
jgi:hypothetical protein